MLCSALSAGISAETPVNDAPASSSGSRDRKQVSASRGTIVILSPLLVADRPLDGQRFLHGELAGAAADQCTHRAIRLLVASLPGGRRHAALLQARDAVLRHVALLEAHRAAVQRGRF